MRKRLAFYIAILVLALLPLLALGETLGSADSFFTRFDGPSCGLSLDEWQEKPGGVWEYAIGKDQEISVVVEEKEIVCITAILAGENKSKAEAILDALLAALEMEAEDAKIGAVAGEKRNSLYLCAPDAFDDLCWQPMLGGQKYHKKPGCNMDGPRLTTVSAAQAQGMEPCSRCWPKKKK